MASTDVLLQQDRHQTGFPIDSIQATWMNDLDLFVAVIYLRVSFLCRRASVGYFALLKVLLTLRE